MVEFGALSKGLNFNHVKAYDFLNATSKQSQYSKLFFSNPDSQLKASPGKKRTEEKSTRIFPHHIFRVFSCVFGEHASFFYLHLNGAEEERKPKCITFSIPFSTLVYDKCDVLGSRQEKDRREGELLTHNRRMLRKKNFPFSQFVAFKWQLNVLTRLMMMPAMEMRILGPFNRRYRRSTPFQNDTKYRLIWHEKWKWQDCWWCRTCAEINCCVYTWTLSPPCNLYPS